MPSTARNKYGILRRTKPIKISLPPNTPPPPHSHKCCFWCAKVLIKADRTKDHLISVPLAIYLKIETKVRNQNCVTACIECNHNRSRISTLLRWYMRCQTKHANGTLRKRHWNRYKYRRTEINELLAHFKEKTNILLHGKIRNICITEIEIVESSKFVRF